MALIVYSGLITKSIAEKYQPPLDVSLNATGLGEIFKPGYADIALHLPYMRSGKPLPFDLWLRFRQDYTLRMRASYRVNKRRWEEILSWPQVTLLAYRTVRSQCWTTLLRAEILPKLGTQDGGELHPEPESKTWVD